MQRCSTVTLFKSVRLTDIFFHTTELGQVVCYSPSIPPHTDFRDRKDKSRASYCDVAYLEDVEQQLKRAVVFAEGSAYFRPNMERKKGGGGGGAFVIGGGNELKEESEMI